MRLAAIDLGSNTIRLLVADADPERGIRPVHGEQVIVRLGARLEASGKLAPESMDRALAVVREYRARARAHGAERVIAVATAAVREAENREEFVERLSTELRLTPRVVTGEEEARLTLLGAVWGVPAVPSPFCLLDIGGGSTELVVARGASPLGGVSLRLGVVSLVERFLHADPVDWADYTACAGYVADRLAAEAWPTIRPMAPRALVGTAGTITTLAALDLGLSAYDPARVQGHRLTVAAMRGLLVRLGALHVAERARLPCLEPGRADLVIPGIAVALAVADGVGLGELTVADTGLREGILLDAVGWTGRVP